MNFLDEILSKIASSVTEVKIRLRAFLPSLNPIGRIQLVIVVYGVVNLNKRIQEVGFSKFIKSLKGDFLTDDYSKIYQKQIKF